MKPKRINELKALAKQVALQGHARNFQELIAPMDKLESVYFALSLAAFLPDDHEQQLRLMVSRMVNLYGDVAICSKRAGGTPAPHGYTIVDVDRGTVLGNPYVMKTEAERDFVCMSFEVYLRNVIANDQNSPITIELANLALRVRRGEKIALRCWCAPKKCHAERLRRVILELAYS